jgi:hypothetical protein
MKTLTGLADRTQPLEDQHLTLPPEQMALLAPTYQQIITKQLGMAAPRDPENAIWLFQVGMKIRSHKDAAPLTLETADFNAMKDACEKNPASYIGFFQGQLIMKLREWEKADAK